MSLKRIHHPPIMLGPIFIHWDGNFETCHHFISHLQIKLSDVQHHNIVFGTDQEAAVIKAIIACFLQATHILCTKHLKENTRENLHKNDCLYLISAVKILNFFIKVNLITFLTALPTQRNFDRGGNLSGLLSGHFPVPEVCRYIVRAGSFKTAQ
jgi:hypothetical protein